MTSERSNPGQRSSTMTDRIRIAPFMPPNVSEGPQPLIINDDWLPTAENLNRLPFPLRHYIMLLETRADPSGDLREAVLLRDMVLELQAALAESDAASRHPGDHHPAPDEDHATAARDS
jgi:hypothetical protein